MILWYTRHTSRFIVLWGVTVKGSKTVSTVCVSHQSEQNVCSQGEGGAYYTFIYLCDTTPFVGHASDDKSSACSQLPSFTLASSLSSCVERLIISVSSISELSGSYIGAGLATGLCVSVGVGGGRGLPLSLLPPPLFLLLLISKADGSVKTGSSCLADSLFGLPSSLTTSFSVSIISSSLLWVLSYKGTVCFAFILL